MAKRATTSADNGGVSPAWFGREASDAALRAAAGGPAWERGLAYAAGGQLELVDQRPWGASFDASGSRRYAVDVDVDGESDRGSLHAACDCWQATGGRMCKHQVAAVLLWRQAITGKALPVAAAPDAAQRAAAQRTAQASAKAAETRAAKRDALLAFLQQQPAPELAQRLWDRAGVDRDLMAEVKAWASSAAAASDPRALGKAVDALLKVSSRQFLERREVQAWAARGAKAVAMLRAALPQHAAQVRTLAEQAIVRADAVQARIAEGPDAGAEITAGLVGVLVDALQGQPPPAAWGEQLLRRIVHGSAYGSPWQEPMLLAAAGADAQRSYARALERAWQQASAAKRRRGKPAADAGDDIDVDTEIDPDQHRGLLRRLMLAQLERQGDPQAEFDFMKASASGVHEHAALIRWCEANGRPREALQLAQRACKLFDDHPLVEDLLLRAYQRDGWDEEALALLRRRFERLPNVEAYAAMLQAAATAHADVPALRAPALAHVQAREEAEFAGERKAYSGFHGPAPQGRDVSRSVALLLHDGDWATALALAQPPQRCAPRLLEMLADRLPRRQDSDAATLLQRCLQTDLRMAQSPYANALRLVAKVLARMTASAGRSFVAELATTYRSKRHFTAGLAALLP